jgi:hypothetical protein
MIRTSRRSLLLFALGSAFVAPSSGCEDTGKLSEQVAVDALPTLTPLVERDVEQIRKGMPEGVKILEKRLPTDPASDRRQIQESIKAARENVKDLAFAKGTFFAFTSPEGIVLRSEADPDRLVDKNLFASFPALAKVIDDKAGLIETWGENEGMRGVKNGPDVAYVAGQAVRGEDGKPRGVFVTGWSFRAYAQYLEDAVRGALNEKAKKAGTTKVPVAYVFIAKGKGAYGTPVAPDVNAEAIAKLDLVEKSAGGVYRGQVEIENRLFGIAAQRAPSLGDDAALVIMASVY